MGARVPFMYLDVKSLVSTGIGNLLDADDPNRRANPARELLIPSMPAHRTGPKLSTQRTTLL